MVIYKNDDNEVNNKIFEALKLLGETTAIETVTLLVTSNDDNAEYNRIVQTTIAELETAMPTSSSPPETTTIRKFDQQDILSSYTELRRLWTFQDECDLKMQQSPPPSSVGAGARAGAAGGQHPNHQLLFDQIPKICQEWSALKWRWNGPKLRDLYRRLRQGQQHQGTEQQQQQQDEKKDSSGDGDDNEFEKGKIIHRYRHDLEQRALQLLLDPETERVADWILSGGATDSNNTNLFGRIHAWAVASSSKQKDTKYLVVTNKKKMNKETAILNGYDYTTISSSSSSSSSSNNNNNNNTAKAMEQLTFVSEQSATQEQFCIPVVVSSPMMTVSLIPAVFPTGVQSSNFDSVLGSRRIWEEHLALKASILYLFQGSPGPLWDLTMQVVQGALPRTWNQLLLQEPPDEAFLQALLHPDVVEAGRLLLLCPERANNGTTTSPTTTTTEHQLLLPPHFGTMSRIFALWRFVQTMDSPKTILKSSATKRSVASTMKLSFEQVEAVLVHACNKQSGSLSTPDCEDILNIKGLPRDHEQEQKQEKKNTSNSTLPEETIEVLGMLGLFLNRDRKSVRDANRFDFTASSDETAYGTTSKVLGECAMYCGAIKWISEDDEEEDGIWTCQSCLHRWQKRNPREAYQTRKLMHPMKMTPFSRQEYYDGDEYDKIMEATDGNISRLGKNFYWGQCTREGCGNVCHAVARNGACAETDGVPLHEIPETVDTPDGQIQLRSSLGGLGALGPNNSVTADSLEKFFDSEEKLLYLRGPVRRRVRNCIDKSTYILPRGLLCEKCAEVPDRAIDEYCPYCGTGFEPVFACVHYSCPHCETHFCKACLGIEGMHFNSVYDGSDHVCWRVLGNRYSYHNKGFCGRCNKERPWPESHALKSAGPEIRAKVLRTGKEMPLSEAIEMQSSNLEAFTRNYKEAKDIFLNCTHTLGLDSATYCQCAFGVNADEFDDF